MSAKFKELTQNTSEHLKTLHKGIPDVMQAFGALNKAASKEGVLSEKTKELIAYALAVGLRCDDCIGFHAKSLVRLGVSAEEVREALGVTILMGGGPAVMYAAHAMQAFEEFSKE